MLPISIIFFRECLEMSIIIGVIISSIKEIKNKKLILVSGIIIGLISSSAIAFLTEKLAGTVEEEMQEIFNAIILFSASFLIAWTVIWMKLHAASLVNKAKEVGRKVSSGVAPVKTVVALIAFTIIREGAEIILFSYGIIIANQYKIENLIIGAVLGGGSAIIIGYTIYNGLMKIPSKYFFKVASWLLIILAANMASQGANILASADILPEIISPIWDTSWIISQNSFAGKLLNSLLGYVAAPSALQLLFYLATIITITLIANFINTNKANAKKFTKAA